jgi:hypothetical protein
MLSAIIGSDCRHTTTSHLIVTLQATEVAMKADELRALQA